MTWILAAAVIVSVSRAGGAVATRLGQPYVVGELLAGLALGPSLFGALAPDLRAQVFGPAELSAVHAIGSMAIAVFMFDVGWHLRPSGGRVATRTVAIVGLPSFLLPALVGAAVGLAVPASSLPATADRAAFVVLTAGAFGITAMPVLAMLVRSLGVEHEMLGRLALSIAAAGDLAAWALLLIAVSLQRGTSVGSIVGPIQLLVLIGLLVVLARIPRLRRAAHQWLNNSAATATVMIVVALLSAYVAERSGLHAALGALIGGCLWPRHAETDQQAIGTLAVISTHALMPFYLADIGMAFDPYRVGTRPAIVAIAAGLCVLAVLVKVAGASLGARFAGLQRVDGYGLGVLLGARGITEIMVLGVGLSAGIINQLIFDIGVVVTIVTTLFAGPGFRWVKARAVRRVRQV